MYEALAEYGLSYFEMYEMTVKELADTLIANRKGFGYRAWKQAYLTAWAVMGKNFPKSPEKASPELFAEQKKKTIKMPDNLLKKEIQKMGGKIEYE